MSSEEEGSFQNILYGDAYKLYDQGTTVMGKFRCRGDDIRSLFFLLTSFVYLAGGNCLSGLSVNEQECSLSRLISVLV